MNSTKRMLQALGALLPLGAVGVSGALAATPAKPIVSAETASASQPGVAERLQAIRTAVSQVTAEQTGLQPGDPNIRKAWWGNGGPGFWANWRPGWGNGGWGNWHNGWHNGGWHNFWRNW